MKIFILCTLVITFLVIVGVPYEYDKDSFQTIDSQLNNEIFVSLSPTTKKTFLGMPVVQAAPYKLSVYCLDKACMPDISKVILETNNSKIELSDIKFTTTNGGMTITNPPLMIDLKLQHEQEILISAVSDEKNINKLSWKLHFQKSKGFSMLPLWIYFTH